MFHFRKFLVRPLFDGDSGNGNGAGDAPPPPPANDNGGGNPPPPPPPPDKNPPKDPQAALRHQISNERDRRIKAETELAEYRKKSSTPPPEFNADNDPDGTKEQAYRAQKIAEEIVEKRLKDSGLDQKLQKIEEENRTKEFFKVVSKTVEEKFKPFGIENPSEDRLKEVLLTIDEKGITPEQIILLANAENILTKLKPVGFTPGTGAKPNNTEKPKTQEEINQSIYAATGAFGYGQQ